MQMNHFVRKVCYAYFDGHHTFLQNLWWNSSSLDKKNEKKHFGIPMIWHEPRNHVHICWFCITPAYGATNKTKHKTQYPYLDSAILPVPHSTEIPVPLFVKFEDYVDLNSSFVFEADDVTDPDFLDISEISIGSLIILNDLSSFWLPG